MILREEITKYLHYCAFQKELDWKTVKAYRQDLEQFAAFMEGHSGEIGKEEIVLPKIIPRNVIEKLFATGMRISELCYLQSSYFDIIHRTFS